MELTWNAVDPIGFEEVELDRSRAAIAQLVARKSPNPKVVFSDLTCHILVATHTHAASNCHTTLRDAQRYRPRETTVLNTCS